MSCPTTATKTSAARAAAPARCCAATCARRRSTLIAQATVRALRLLKSSTTCGKAPGSHTALQRARAQRDTWYCSEPGCLLTLTIASRCVWLASHACHDWLLCACSLKRQAVRERTHDTQRHRRKRLPTRESCPGPAGEHEVPGGDDDAWVCWSCAARTKQPYAHPDSAARALRSRSPARRPPGSCPGCALNLAYLYIYIFSKQGPLFGGARKGRPPRRCRSGVQLEGCPWRELAGRVLRAGGAGSGRRRRRAARVARRRGHHVL